MSIVACLVSMLISATSLAQVDVVLVPPPTPAIAGETTEITLYFTNATTENVSFQVPASLTGTLVLDEASSPIELQLVDDAKAKVMSLQAQGFDQRLYRTRLPAGISGPGQLRIDGWQANAPYVMIAPAREPMMQTDDGGRPGTDRAAEPEGETVSEAPEAPESTNIFLDNISAYEPIYFLYGPGNSDAKFQFSFKYRFLNAEGTLARKWPWLSGLHVAFTQTSFWDLDEESLPFEDTNFTPELLYLWEDIDLPVLPRQTRFDLQLGFQHESNGRGGDDSRSLNRAYIRPTITSRLFDDYELSLAAKAWLYVGSSSDNPDIEDYRGWSSLSASLGRREGFLLASQVRGNLSTGKGSFQVDWTYPLSKFFFNNFDLYLQLQFFTGYGENLLHYDEKETQVRLGFGIVR
jgi:outer membrane phospholipase A